MIKSDFHVHTTFCDGRSDAETVVKQAIALGMDRIGFSAHSHTDFDLRYCLRNAEAYRAEIARLAGKYSGSIAVFCGIEQDIFCEEPTDVYDYVIGSVHYFHTDGGYYDVDGDPEDLLQTVRRQFGGDFYKAAACYFETVASLPQKQKIDIIGHFDLISKYNEIWKLPAEKRPLSSKKKPIALDRPLFDPGDARYVRAWKYAADALLKTGLPFEINTGAISRGYKAEAYPAPEMIAYIRERGGRFILSSDSHRADTLLYRFADYEALAQPFALRKR